MCLNKINLTQQMVHFLQERTAGFYTRKGNIAQTNLPVKRTTMDMTKEVHVGYVYVEQRSTHVVCWYDVPSEDVYECSRSVSRLFCTVAFPLRFSPSRSFRKRCSSSNSCSNTAVTYITVRTDTHTG